jgi:UDP-glucose 4-epimerase
MKCAIVGAGGFIGRHLGRSSREAGHDVTGFDVVDPGDGDPGFPLHVRDACADRVELPAGVDVVFYLAQSPHHRVFPRHADHLFDVNVTGALRTASAASEAGAGLFVYASTGTVYAPGFEPMAEDRAVRRDHGYALSKVCGEEALTALCAGGSMRLACPRLFGVFGPGQNAMLVPAIAARVREGRPVTIEPHPHDPGDDGGLRMSLTFVDDLVRCLLDLATKMLADASAGRPAGAPPLNMASDTPVSVRTLAERIGAEFGVEPRFEIADVPRASDYVADVSRLRSLVEARFTPIDHALARTLLAPV